jgi:hypothetical protein
MCVQDQPVTLFKADFFFPVNRAEWNGILQNSGKYGKRSCWNDKKDVETSKIFPTAVTVGGQSYTNTEGF